MKVNDGLRGLVLTVLVLATLLPSSSVFARDFWEVSLMAGHRQDSLDWNIRGNTGPNVLSELTWRDLSIFQLRGDIVAANHRGIYVRGSASYGWVLSGENQDSDYDGDNRTLEWSRSVNGVDGSKVMGLKGGIGFVVFPEGNNNHYSFAPLLGFAYHNQYLKMTDGRQVIPALGPFAGLNSSYDASWLGPWVGVDFSFELASKNTLTLRLEHHWSEYSAEANWNLRDDFVHPVSFEHEADGRGLVVELGWQSPPAHGDWQLGVNLNWQNWTTDTGIDRTYVTEYEDALGNTIICTPYCIGMARLNEVNWSSSQINITVSREIDL